MKLDLKKKLVRRFYLPVVLRMEKAKAVKMWQEGIKQCDEAQKKVNKPRFYLLFNRRTGKWMPLCYERRKDAISISQLIGMGKMHLTKSHKPTVAEIKQECFYYTHSAWGAPGCKDKIGLMRQKQAEWIAYYLTYVSTPMRKVSVYLHK